MAGSSLFVQLRAILFGFLLGVTFLSQFESIQKAKSSLTRKEPPQAALSSSPANTIVEKEDNVTPLDPTPVDPTAVSVDPTSVKTDDKHSADASKEPTKEQEKPTSPPTPALALPKHFCPKCPFDPSNMRGTKCMDRAIYLMQKYTLTAEDALVSVTQAQPENCQPAEPGEGVIDSHTALLLLREAVPPPPPTLAPVPTPPPTWAPYRDASLLKEGSTKIRDFEKQDHVVIAVKIHSTPHAEQLKQSLCLLDVAYNSRLLYDIVVFITEPLTDQDTQDLHALVAPANLTIVRDSPPLPEVIANLTETQQKKLVERCHDVNSTQDLAWWTRCHEPGGGDMPINYCWMSEFRSKQLWTQPVLRPYKYMMWYDSDAMATQMWQQDPVAFMIRNQLALLVANFGAGNSKGKEVQDKIYRVYNRTLCWVDFSPEGHMAAKTGGKDECAHQIRHVHGFFHITDLDFYRSPINLEWSNVMIGDNKFSRKWDDQLAVTVPPAMLAKDRAWDMESMGLLLEVWHNGAIMGKRKWVGGGFRKWWAKESKESFPEAIDKCSRHIKNSGRRI